MALLKMKSEIAGSVSEVFVQIGDAIKEGDILMEIESMKMLVPLMSSDDGVVKEILVKKGDKMDAGDVAIILEG